jgi:hypothetical protein
MVTDEGVAEALATAEWASHPFAPMGNGLLRTRAKPS